MDTEQLKLIIQALQGAGEGAKTIALWWLILPAVTKIITSSIFAVVIIKGITMIGRLIKGSIMGVNTTFSKNVIEALGMDKHSSFGYEDDISYTSATEAIDKIRELQKK